jgi:hypothetical protein
VARSATGGRPKQLLVQDLAAAGNADGGVGRRGVEADDCQFLWAALSQ